MIAAVSNRGEFYFTINHGTNNGHTFLFFLMTVAKHLEKKDSNWRESTVIMIDNASYHRSAVMVKRYEALKLPIMFLGPY